ncbi:MAG: hypothetical protein AAFV86_20970, partial [Pseudomonadota bacterium]
MARHSLISGLAATSVALAAGMASAQAQMNTSGVQNLAYIGPQVHDFLVPDLPGSKIRFTVRGADGGDSTTKRSFGTCTRAGGEGATVVMQATIGYGTYELRPGARVRFIVGEEGGSVRREDDWDGAGGGGGTGLLYDADNDDLGWIPLAVAGAGGGAHTEAQAGICTRLRNGKGASLEPTGTDGDGDKSSQIGAGGKDGSGGGDGDRYWIDRYEIASGGGGGLKEDGEFKYASGTPARAGSPSGGAGGTSKGSSGGWGCGGGGAGRSNNDFDGGGGGG